MFQHYRLDVGLRKRGQTGQGEASDGGSLNQ
jgi:hypothetical protein